MEDIARCGKWLAQMHCRVELLHLPPWHTFLDPTIPRHAVKTRGGLIRATRVDDVFLVAKIQAEAQAMTEEEVVALSKKHSVVCS